MNNVRPEMDSLGWIDVPAGELWGTPSWRSLQHFSIGRKVMPAGSGSLHNAWRAKDRLMTLTSNH